MSQNDNPYGYVSSPSSPEFVSPPPTPDAQSQSYTQPHHPLVPLSSDEDEEDQLILSPLPVQFPPPAAVQFPPPAAAAPLQAIAEGQLPAAALPQQQPQIMVYPAIAYSTQEDPRNQPKSFMNMSQTIQQQNSALLSQRGPTSRKKGGTRRRYKKRKSKYTTNKHPIKSKNNKINKKKSRRYSRYY